MIDWARLIIAIILFTLGAYLIVDLFISGFDLVLLVAALGCFALAYHIKPRHKSDEYDAIFDIVDLIVELPFRVIAFLLRGLGRIFKDGIDGISLDV
jgi:hypothetical protein